MKKKALLTAIVSGFVLMGCAYPWPRVTSTADCTGNACRVVVSVEELDSRGCVPDAIPDTLNVTAKGAVVIKWEFDTASESKGYRFPNDGIVFVDASQFECALAEQGKKFVCTDKNSNPGTYKYTINVIKGPANCTPRDPSVVNN